MLCKQCSKGNVIWESKVESADHPSQFIELMKVPEYIKEKKVKVFLLTCAHFGYLVTDQLQIYQFNEKKCKLTSRRLISNKIYPHPITLIRKDKYMVLFYCDSEPRSAEYCRADVYFEEKLTIESIGGDLYNSKRIPFDKNEVLDFKNQEDAPQSIFLCLKAKNSSLIFFEIVSGREFKIKEQPASSEYNEQVNFIIATPESFLCIDKGNKIRVFDYVDGTFELLEDITMLPLTKASDKVNSVCLSPSEEFLFVSYFNNGVYGVRSYSINDLSKVALSDNTAATQNNICKQNSS